MSAPPNGNADDRHEASHADYEELRAHVPLTRPASATPDEDESEAGSKISVMDWLVDVGHQVVRRFRTGTRAPRAPMVRIHGR